MTAPIDTAYVDIVARDRSLRKLEKDIDDTFDDIDKNIKKDLDTIDDRFEDLFTRIDKRFDDLEDSVDGVFFEVVGIAQRAADDIEEDFDRATSSVKKNIRDIGDEADDAFDNVDRGFLRPFRVGMSKIGELIGETGRVLGQLGGAVGGLVSSSPLLALILALTPAIIALAAALSNLIGLVGLLPSGLSVLLATIIPVVVAFQNFGDAVSAVSEGDIEKINEALKKLSPSAAAVAQEIGRLLPQLRAFQRSVQEAFFAQISGGLTQLANATLPTLTAGFQAVAASMGRFIDKLIDMVSGTDNVRILGELFATTGRIVDRVGSAIVSFLDSMFNTIDASLPTVERLANSFANALEQFSAFINKSVETGEFNKFIDDALTTVRELVDLVKALGGLLGTLFAGTEEEGHNFIKTLTELTTRLDNFLKSAEGQDAIDSLVIAVKLLALALETTLEGLILLAEIGRTSLQTLEDIGRGFFKLIDTIGEFLGKIPEAVEKFFNELPEKATKSFNAMIDAILIALGTGIGVILFVVEELPKQIIGFLESLPQKIYDIIVKVGPVIGDAFQGAIDIGRNIITNGIDEIVEFIKSVPGRIAELVPNFKSSGKNLIESFMNGFRSVGSFIGDVAGDIVGAVKGFLNKAIDKINSGIAIIDNLLPGDLGRIPRLADGAVVRHRPGGILANIGEGREDEVVAPLSDLENMINGGGTTITFGPGSINVNFTGVVPTETEAFSVGQAVGQGIISTIAQRNLRAQVRAM